jgi:hypothetical protein
MPSVATRLHRFEARDAPGVALPDRAERVHRHARSSKARGAPTDLGPAHESITGASSALADNTWIQRQPAALSGDPRKSRSRARRSGAHSPPRSATSAAAARVLILREVLRWKAFEVAEPSKRASPQSTARCSGPCDPRDERRQRPTRPSDRRGGVGLLSRPHPGIRATTSPRSSKSSQRRGAGSSAGRAAPSPRGLDAA